MGRRFHRAVTTLHAPALPDEPPSGVEGGSTAVRRWRRREREPRNSQTASGNLISASGRGVAESSGGRRGSVAPCTGSQPFCAPRPHFRRRSGLRSGPRRVRRALEKSSRRAASATFVARRRPRSTWCSRKAMTPKRSDAVLHVADVCSNGRARRRRCADGFHGHTIILGWRRPENWFWATTRGSRSASSNPTIATASPRCSPGSLRSSGAGDSSRPGAN
jgi:hypothetical protein